MATQKSSAPAQTSENRTTSSADYSDVLPDERTRKRWLQSTHLRNHIPTAKLETIQDLKEWCDQEIAAGENFRDEGDSFYAILYPLALERVADGAEIWLDSHGLWDASDPLLRDIPRRTKADGFAIGDPVCVDQLKVYVSGIRKYIASKEENGSDTISVLGAIRPRKGISLRDAAVVINQGDSELAPPTKKRWQNSTDPVLPTPIGKSSRHKQTDLYDVGQLSEFIAKVDPGIISKDKIQSMKIHLQPTLSTPPAQVR